MPTIRIIGFTHEVGLAEMTELAHRYGAVMMDDLGSGTLLDTARFGLVHEPTVQESLAAGVDVVCFSGDKLLGGPQAGIIAGRAGLVAKLKRHPLARALRADKFCLAALSATLFHYLKGEGECQIPVWRMIATPTVELRKRAQYWLDCLGAPPPIATIIPGLSTVGGGTLPDETFPTFLLAITVSRPERLLASLRKTSPPVIARIENQQVVLDPRTVLPEQDDLLVGLLKSIVLPEA